MSARKLRQYFPAHPIIVVNEAPFSNILNNPEATRRVSLWGTELSPRDITYEKNKRNKVANLARLRRRVDGTSKHGTPGFFKYTAHEF
jgi:hypothetical protein